MYKLLIAGALLAVSANAAAKSFPTAEEAKAELVAAGVSAEAAAGIVSIAEQYTGKFEQSKTDREAGKEVFAQFHTAVEKYIATRPSDDQAAYKDFVDKKKAERQGNHSTPSV
ncbi:unnamed protein product [Caenorhabditis sp. 36 PRJEB53466]|nr:unnamed protein product [Caenorhabditis sp. 36 PRJEB53466]